MRKVLATRNSSQTTRCSLLGGVDGTRLFMFNLQEHFKAIQLCFDEVIERLPASGPLLAHIKVNWYSLDTSVYEPSVYTYR